MGNAETKPSAIQEPIKDEPTPQIDNLSKALVVSSTSLPL